MLTQPIKPESDQNNKKISRPGFAKLMARVFEIDILECPRCHSKMQTISFVRDPKAIKDILRSLKMSTAPPEIAEPAHQIVYEEEEELFMDDTYWCQT